ncbi:multiple sugar transport system substrate-binding protein/sorbitol/mannitol transport system substrate-binding protein [Monaibacterium marinum]|uniref:Multiple sugar transport system substrate-binding protein/sorbitol/mannitol transport system substrate-binding protein n=1 Tax=Pontivivens marinum TaxID=1690039 RepID=A0A2C9CUK4_9RHOB|nr:sugar ABC transporter substrate-binding protein [Monaibacterium marinum]SOH94893.1 multiple sugar transport system substrate-binding protein/sorbitol/mannitol transport system substrate-binding protein [Monaibacterium marinum]
MSVNRILLSTAVGFASITAFTSIVSAEEITIATVNNADMITMQQLAPQWEDATGNSINWVFLSENDLRDRTTQDIAVRGGAFDVMFIGAYEASTWGAYGWLTPLNDFADDADYNLDDIFPLVRNGLSADGNLFAVPLYSETSFTFYRTDLFEAAGIEPPTEQITYTRFAQIAAALHDPENGVYGTCLRGKAGWGENMAFVGTLANAFGGRWLDEDWNPQLDSPEWHNAITYYVDLLNASGPPDSFTNGHLENRALFADGRCATWIDATSAAGAIRNPEFSSVADVTDFFQAPMQETSNGTGWFWSWALAIPETSQNKDVAKDFLKWATSVEYFELVGETEGWVAVPSGARQSIEEDPRRLQAAPYAPAIVEAILSVDTTNPTRDPVPYNGIQIVPIPEFQCIGNYVGQQIALALAGLQSVEQSLANSQSFAVPMMRNAGYIQ